MKKFLSLVLALVMTMSLVTISAGAKDFTDGDDIQYTEAVDVISAIEVVDGYTDGSFNPDATLTRGAAAKIICNLLLGPTTASALSADTAPFSDVPTTNTFAGYIAYCSQQGIISGYADGTFRPAGTLTSYAFMKMLLGALGYDSEVEGYVGANWSVQVAKTALGIGLDDGLVDDFNGLKAVTREEACLYAFNTLTANMVKYGSTTNIVIGDAQVNVNGEREWDDDVTNTDGHIGGKWVVNADGDEVWTGDGIVQFAERYFTKLVLNGNARDSFARPSNTWTYKGDLIGTYAQTADAKYVKSTAEADIYADTAMTSNLTYTVYVDGVLANNYKANTAQDRQFYDANSEVVVNKGEEDDKIGLGNGAIVEVFKEERVITIMNTYVGEVVAVEEATSKRDAYIELAQLEDKVGNVYTNGSSNAVLDSYTFTTEGFEVGDIVTFNYSLKGTDGEVKNVKAAEEITGDVESFTTDKKFSMDGTTYEYGAKKVNVYGSSDIGTESTVYMDENGYVLYAKEGSENNKNYALVLNAGPKTSISTAAHQAWLLFADGTTKVVDTDKSYYTGSDNLIGEWVTFKTNSKDQTVLTSPSGTQVGVYDNNASTETTLETKNGETGVKLQSTNEKVNSATVIIVRDSNDNFKVYEGVKGIPTIGKGTPANNQVGDTAGYKTTANGFLKFLYVDLGDCTDFDTGSDKTIFLVADSNSNAVETTSDKYYVFDAVVDGVLVEDGVMLDATDALTCDVIDVLRAANGRSILLDSYSVDDGFYTVKLADEVGLAGSDGDTLNVANGDTNAQIRKVSGDCIEFAGAAYYTAKDCVFYRVDDKGNLKKSSINGVRTDYIDTNPNTGRDAYYESIAYVYNNDAELTGVYWVEK